MEIDKSLIINENDNLNVMRDKIHQNAINHGWYNENAQWLTDDNDKYCALMHSEVSEILEEFRQQEPKELYFDNYVDKIQVYKKYHRHHYHLILDFYARNDFSYIKNYKPLGYGIELADLVIRALDFCGRLKLDVNNINFGDDEWIIERDLFEIINILHSDISNVACQDFYHYIEDIIGMCFNIAKKYNINLNKMIEIKHKYNLTRPIKHGKRF